MPLSALASTVTLAVVLFVVTNIDDIFIIVAFFADRKLRAREIVVGQYVGLGALTLICVIAALVALVIPSQYIGLLGLLPIALGVKELIEQWRDADDDDDADEARVSAASSIGKITAVSMVTIANGGDNIGVYIPVFATRSAAELVVIVSVFAVMTGVWCVLAHWLVSHRTIGAPLRRYGHRALPYVLIGLGVLILYQAGTLALLQ
jgi:cadmium resistance transport/sequestration family protein